MSLILEALKKLERERHSPDRGFLVLGPGAWSNAPGGRSRMALALVGAVLLGAAAGTAFWRVRDTGRRPPAATLPSPAVAGVPAGPPPSPLFAATLPHVPPPGPVASAAPIEPRVVVPEIPSVVEEAPAPREERDRPVESDTAPAEPEPRFRLQAISRRDDRLVAVLSGRLVYEGDSFEDVRVLRIGETEVELEVAGRRVVVGF